MKIGTSVGTSGFWSSSSSPSQSMDIVRVAGTERRVTLHSMEVPSSVDVIFDGKSWRLDPAPIIAFRLAAQATDR